MTRSLPRPRSARLRRGTLAAALVLLAATGCRSDDAQPDGGQRTPTAEYDQPPGPVGGPTLDPGDPVTEELTGNAVSGPWTLAAAPDPGAASVRIWAELTGCHSLRRAVAAETEATVTIAVLLRDESAPDVECDASVIYQPVDVGLGAPLGDRELRHAAEDIAATP
jgi:hypothetical protein